MIRLDATTRKLQALLGGAITTNQLPITVCYSDKTSTAYTGGTTVINSNNTTAVDICAAPAASTVRDVDTINVNNADTVAATITIRYNDNGTTYTLFKATLATGDQLTYVHGVGWRVDDANGALKNLSPANYKLSAFAATTSAELATVISDETGSGLLVFGTSPTLTTPVLSGTVTGTYLLSGTPTINLSSGAVGTPSLYLNGETTSGLYRIGANNHGYAISGAKVLDISSTGLAVTGTLNVTGNIASTAGRISATLSGQSAVFNGATGTYATWQYNGTSVGDIGTADEAVGGSTSDFGITSRAGNLVFGTSSTTRATLSSTDLTLTVPITTSAPTGGAGAWELGIANAVSPTSPNRTITIEIGGTAYYLHAKTTND